MVGLSEKSVPIPLYKFLFPKFVALGEVKLGLQRHLFHLNSVVPTTDAPQLQGSSPGSGHHAVLQTQRVTNLPGKPSNSGPSIQPARSSDLLRRVHCFSLKVGNWYNKPSEWSCHIRKCQSFIPSSHTYAPVYTTSESLHLSGTDDLSEERSPALPGQCPRAARSTLSGHIY